MEVVEFIFSILTEVIKLHLDSKSWLITNKTRPFDSFDSQGDFVTKEQLAQLRQVAFDDAVKIHEYIWKVESHDYYFLFMHYGDDMPNLMRGYIVEKNIPNRLALLLAQSEYNRRFEVSDFGRLVQPRQDRIFLPVPAKAS